MELACIYEFLFCARAPRMDFVWIRLNKVGNEEVVNDIMKQQNGLLLLLWSISNMGREERSKLLNESVMCRGLKSKVNSVQFLV